MSVTGRWVPDGPENNHVARPISNSYVSSTIIFSYGISLMVWENIIAFQKLSVYEFLCPFKKILMILCLHLSISCVAPLLPPSLEFWGPAHWPLDKGELPPPPPHRGGDGNRCESTTWWSLLAVLWIQCHLEHSPGKVPQYPLSPCLGSGLVLSSGLPWRQGHTPFS